MDEAAAGWQAARHVDEGLALEDPNGRRVVLVTSDFQGVPKEMSDRVFAQLRKKWRWSVIR